MSFIQEFSGGSRNIIMIIIVITFVFASLWIILRHDWGSTAEIVDLKQTSWNFQAGNSWIIDISKLSTLCSFDARIENEKSVEWIGRGLF